MEVHAHAHTARKRWTHYFWEFLMLFLISDKRGVASVRYSNPASGGRFQTFA